MNNQTFTECFCGNQKIANEKFADEVLARSLYPHARLVKWLLIFYDPYYFASDYELILSIGELRRSRDFQIEADRFNEHPANCGWLRRKFLLRVSTRRLRGIIRETLGHHAAQTGQIEKGFSAVPFKKPALLDCHPRQGHFADARLQRASMLM